MKFLCTRCERLVELLDFKLEAASLVLTCPSCGGHSRAGSPASITGERPALQLKSIPGTSNVVALRSPGSDAVAAAAEASATAPFGVPAGRCPKCIAPRPSNASTCTQCGLTFSAFDPSQVAPTGWLERAWIDLLADWGNEPLHAKLRVRALAEQDLATVGRLYRLRLVAHAEDPFAQRGRDEVLRLALVPTKAPTPNVLTEKIDSKWKYAWVGLVLIVCLVLLGLMARAMLPSQ